MGHQHSMQTFHAHGKMRVPAEPPRPPPPCHRQQVPELPFHHTPKYVPAARIKLCKLRHAPEAAPQDGTSHAPHHRTQRTTHDDAPALTIHRPCPRVPRVSHLFRTTHAVCAHRHRHRKPLGGGLCRARPPQAHRRTQRATSVKQRDPVQCSAPFRDIPPTTLVTAVVRSRTDTLPSCESKRHAPTII